MTNLEFYKEEIKKNGMLETFKKYFNFSETSRNYGYRNDIIDWLCEEHSILDEEEKEYLSAVIKPFRNRFKYIAKYTTKWNDNTFEYISICLKETTSINFPLFRKGTMYKGMKLDKKYTLEELGL